MSRRKPPRKRCRRCGLDVRLTQGRRFKTHEAFVLGPLCGASGQPYIDPDVAAEVAQEGYDRALQAVADDAVAVPR